MLDINVGVAKEKFLKIKRIPQNLCAFHVWLTPFMISKLCAVVMLFSHSSINYFFSLSHAWLIIGIIFDFFTLSILHQQWSQLSIFYSPSSKMPVTNITLYNPYQSTFPPIDLITLRLLIFFLPRWALMVSLLSYQDDLDSTITKTTNNEEGTAGYEPSVVEYFVRAKPEVAEEYSPTDIKIMEHDRSGRCESW